MTVAETLAQQPTRNPNPSDDLTLQQASTLYDMLREQRWALEATYNRRMDDDSYALANWYRAQMDDLEARFGREYLQ